MATVNKVPVTILDSLQGTPPPQLWYPEAASQSFKRGELVYLDGSGRVAEYTAAIDDGTQRFLGFAAEDGHNDTVAETHRVGVYIPVLGTVIEMNVTAAAGADQVTAITQVGSGPLPFYQDTVNSRVAVDISDTASQGDWIRILDLSPRDVVGDTNGRVLVTIVPAALQVSGT